MKEEVDELFREGLTVDEISEETGLASGTVNTYVTSSGVRYERGAREAQIRAKIRKLEEELKTLSSS